MAAFFIEPATGLASQRCVFGWMRVRAGRRLSASENFDATDWHLRLPYGAPRQRRIPCASSGEIDANRRRMLRSTCAPFMSNPSSIASFRWRCLQPCSRQSFSSRSRYSPHRPPRRRKQRCTRPIAPRSTGRIHAWRARKSIFPIPPISACADIRHRRQRPRASGAVFIPYRWSGAIRRSG
jgi:hypothetical protein